MPPGALGHWLNSRELNLALRVGEMGVGRGLFLPICSCLAWRRGSQSWVLLLYDVNLPQMFVGMWLDVDLCIWDSPKLSVKAIFVNAGCRELGRETVAGCPGGTPGCMSSGWGLHTPPECQPPRPPSVRFHTSSLAHKGQEPWPCAAWRRLEKGFLWAFPLRSTPAGGFGGLTSWMHSMQPCSTPEPCSPLAQWFLALLGLLVFCAHMAC